VFDLLFVSKKCAAREVISGLLIIGNSYEYISTQYTWSEAEAVCQSTYGTSLASIYNAVQNAEATALCTAGASYNFCWLGLNDLTTDGSWYWRNSHSYNAYAANYTNWNSGEPNGAESENCVHLYSSGVLTYGGLWNDRGCDTEWSALCNAHSWAPTNS
jgi:hypothetical protein